LVEQFTVTVDRPDSRQFTNICCASLGAAGGQAHPSPAGTAAPGSRPEEEREMRIASVAITPTQTYPAYAGASRSANQVTVLFEDGARSFSMPTAATFRDLAERLARERGSARRRMLAVVVKFDRETST
jgi:hypothetical protein